MSTGLLTDRYELTMLDAALRDSTAGRHCVFEVFARRLPEGRRYGVVAGTARLLDAIADYTFDAATVESLHRAGVVGEAAAAYLGAYRFRGDVDGYAEGELYFPYSPLCTVSGTFAETVVLETLVLSILNHDSAIASAAARMVSAAHAFTLLHDDEAAAFRAQIATLGTDTTLLVDTYDLTAGIAAAVEVAGPTLGAIRIDSGDLGVLARQARAQLDALGATGTRVIVSGDLDEYSIAALGASPVDAYGAGTAVVTGSGAPTAGMVYKLVEVDGRPVAKRSEHKESQGARKTAYRVHKPTGTAVEEVVVAGAAPDLGEHDRLLQRPLMRDGGPVPDLPGLDASRAHLRRALVTLPWDGLKLSRGEPAIPTRIVPF